MFPRNQLSPWNLIEVQVASVLQHGGHGNPGSSCCTLGGALRGSGQVSLRVNIERLHMSGERRENRVKADRTNVPRIASSIQLVSEQKTASLAYL